MRIYLCGPMRGIKAWNFPAFDVAEKCWLEAGHKPFSPAQIDRVLQYGPEVGESEVGLRHVISMDIACLMAAEGIALLPGWEGSRGAAVELALAQFLGLKVFDAVTMMEINPKQTPWKVGDSCI